MRKSHRARKRWHLHNMLSCGVLVGFGGHFTTNLCRELRVVICCGFYHCDDLMGWQLSPKTGEIVVGFDSNGRV